MTNEIELISIEEVQRITEEIRQELEGEVARVVAAIA